MTIKDKLALPTAEEVAIAQECSREISAYLETGGETQQIDISARDGKKHAISIPTRALSLLADILAQLGQGNAVKIIPIHAELTTQEAADILNVSRPYLVRMLEHGEIPHHKVGRHRRVRYQDLMDYKMAVDARRSSALDELSALSQKYDPEY
ncbi:helix-turn-helix domain-containing protein [Salinisphaera sp. G21_0]|uniref:helix-turn-helix domain-containing protein n=1 Tax=Salinisphaera sp. G21_0 TaxID=2821094 RepID=UPI001ADCFA71|nr:helix-turn-helix domain-containing protein [Salinisphaera sp. G21_0]MBO9482836.1 helix-turn-helix domain-containing protein [Salinisphaera sp. G21_0]